MVRCGGASNSFYPPIITWLWFSPRIPHISQVMVDQELINHFYYCYAKGRYVLHEKIFREGFVLVDNPFLDVASSHHEETSLE